MYNIYNIFVGSDIMYLDRIAALLASAALCAAAVNNGNTFAAAVPELPNIDAGQVKSAAFREEDYVLDMNTTVTYTFQGAEVLSAVSSDTSVASAELIGASQVRIASVSPGSCDITIGTSFGSDYDFVIHITVPGEGVTTSPPVIVTTQTTASTKKAATTTTAVTTSKVYSQPAETDETTSVSTVSTVPVQTTQPSGIIEKPSGADGFAAAVKTSENFEVKYNTFNVNPKYDMFGSLDYVQEMQDSQGNIFAAVGDKDTLTVIQKDTFHHAIINNPGYTFGAATIGDDDHIYAIWGKDQTSSGSNADNIVITKFTPSGQYVAMYPINSSITTSMYPFDAGNARLAYHDGKLLAVFDTEWESGHQGAEMFRLDTATGKYDFSKTNICSHSFGIDLIMTENSFVTLQKGDCYERGLIMHELEFNSNNYKRAKTIAWHSSGVYSEPGEHQNATFTHMGGAASASDTFAIAGKSERFYTSHDYTKYKNGIYDVFVRIMSRAGDNTDLAGEDRIDEYTGEVADTNVIWLTNCDENNRAGNVKVVSLSGDRYCVLWEVLNTAGFDHVAYTILDSKGNTLQPETVLSNARLSSTSVAPIVQDDVLTWAVADKNNGTLDWYTFDTNEPLQSGEVVSDPIGDVNSDGEVSVADLVMFSNYLLGNGELDMKQASAADMDGDGIADTFDLVLLRQKLIEEPDQNEEQQEV